MCVCINISSLHIYICIYIIVGSIDSIRNQSDFICLNASAYLTTHTNFASILHIRIFYMRLNTCNFYTKYLSIESRESLVLPKAH